MICFHNNISSYYKYFEGLYSSSELITTVGDITPSYAGLSSKILSTIKYNLEAIGFAVKVIFLMRDPVERIWSSVRMGKRNSKSLVKKKKSDEELISNFYKTKNYFRKTSYDKTIINLEKVFDPNMIFYSLYEDLFKKETIDRLIKFAEIDMIYENFDLDSYSNSSPKKEFISEELKSEIVNYYSPVYKFISSRFDVQEKWKSINLLKN